MARLHFKNAQLLPLLAFTENATTFKLSLGDAVAAYEKGEKKKWEWDVEIPQKYYETNQPCLYIVKDTGIYLMTAAKLEKLPEDGSHVCYAVGYAPNTPNLWGKCRDAVGGDDFGETIGFSKQLQEDVKKGCDIIINLTATKITVAALLPKRAA